MGKFSDLIDSVIGFFSGKQKKPPAKKPPPKPPAKKLITPGLFRSLGRIWPGSIQQKSRAAKKFLIPGLCVDLNGFLPSSIQQKIHAKKFLTPGLFVDDDQIEWPDSGVHIPNVHIGLSVDDGHAWGEGPWGWGS